MATDEITPSGVSVDHTVDDDIRLTAYINPLTGEVIRLVLPIEMALDLARNLVNQATYAVRDILVDIKSGDCETCGNTRLVKTSGPGGRESNDRCPDCGPAYAEANGDVFARPRIGGGVQ